jgi:hypothetical protein
MSRSNVQNAFQLAEMSRSARLTRVPIARARILARQNCEERSPQKFRFFFWAAPVRSDKRGENSGKRVTITPLLPFKKNFKKVKKNLASMQILP